MLPKFVLQKNVQKATWVTGRLALSQQSSRFTLPIDMARLERKSSSISEIPVLLNHLDLWGVKIHKKNNSFFVEMTPLDYVKNFCIIKRRRKKLYQDIFVKHKDKTGSIPFKVGSFTIRRVVPPYMYHRYHLSFTFIFEPYYMAMG